MVADNKKRELTPYDLQVLEHQRRLQKEFEEIEKRIISKGALEIQRRFRKATGQKEEDGNSSKNETVWCRGKWKWKIKRG